MYILINEKSNATKRGNKSEMGQIELLFVWKGNSREYNLQKRMNNQFKEGTEEEWQAEEPTVGLGPGVVCGKA